MKTIEECYLNSKYLSIKWDSYFDTYGELFSNYRGKPITFVEVGVLNGGSLFMWRDFFGSNARIIGIDFNSEAKKWTKDGFEIHIGDQSSKEFWVEFFEKVGKIDILLDDGGHTNKQQITTVNCAVDYINNGGMVVVEDTHASYMRDFGNPSNTSFIEYIKKMMDSINLRSGALDGRMSRINKIVQSISIYESIIALKIDREHCKISRVTSNNGKSSNAIDYRYKNIGKFSKLNDWINKNSPHWILPVKVVFTRLAKKLTNKNDYKSIKQYYKDLFY